MSRHWDSIAQRRREVRRLKDKLGWSVRKIARHVGVSVGTVHADLKATEGDRPPNPAGHPATIQPPPNPAGPGNQRRRTHGAYSDEVVRPLRERRHEQLVERYPFKSPEDLMPLADRLGRIDAITLWEAENGIVGDKRGSVFQASSTKDEWARRAERVVAELEAERDRHLQANSLSSGQLTPGEWAELEDILARSVPGPGLPPAPRFVPTLEYDRLIVLLERVGVEGVPEYVLDFRLDWFAWYAGTSDGVRFRV